MDERHPEPELPHLRRAWRDAEACYRSPFFYGPVAAAATVAAAAAALLPESASLELKVILAVASAARIPFMLGLLILITTLLRAPRKRREDQLKARIESLEAMQVAAESSQTTIFAPGSNFYLGGEQAVRGLGKGITGTEEHEPPNQ